MDRESSAPALLRPEEDSASLVRLVTDGDDEIKGLVNIIVERLA